MPFVPWDCSLGEALGEGRPPHADPDPLYGQLLRAVHYIPPGGVRAYSHSHGKAGKCCRGDVVYGAIWGSRDALRGALKWFRLCCHSVEQIAAQSRKDPNAL